MIGLARTTGTGWLRHQQQLAEARGGNDELRLSVDLAQGPVLGGLAPAFEQRLSARLGQGRQPALIGRQRQGFGQVIGQQMVEGVRSVVAAEEALGRFDQLALVGCGHLVTGLLQRGGQMRQAAWHVEIGGGDIPFAIGMVPEHHGQALFGWGQPTQPRQTVDLGQQRVELLRDRNRFAILDGGNHQRIGHAPAFRHRQQGGGGARRDAAA